MKVIVLLTSVLISSLMSAAQIPPRIAVQILKAEDSRAYDQRLADLIKSTNLAVQIRAALAIGRIGNDAAVPVLADLLDNSPSSEVRAMAAFAIGEIESVKGIDVVLKTLKDSTAPDPVRARAVEAAGKIAAANAKDEKAKVLGERILDTLDAEEKKGAKQNRDVILQSITAALRAKPSEAGAVLVKFLTNLDPRIRGDAGNAIARLEVKNANAALRAMLMTDGDANARANAARALGAAGDKEAFNLLLDAAATDDDSRVRVSAIRSLASLKDARAADKLLERAEKLLAAYRLAKFANPVEKSELLEISTVLGRLLAKTENKRAVDFLSEFGRIDKFMSAEIGIARIRVSQRAGKGDSKPPDLTQWRQYSFLAQFIGEVAVIESTDGEFNILKGGLRDEIRKLAKLYAGADPDVEKASILAAPDMLRAFARFKTPDLAEVLRKALKNKDIFIRSTAAGLIAELPPSPENISALQSAFEYARVNDVKSNDAILAIVGALIKVDRIGSMETWTQALISPDHLVRRRVRDEIPDDIRKITSKELLFEVNKPVGPGTRMGQVLNRDADYQRTLSKKNGTVKAVVTTAKGIFAIDLFPEDAPLTVDNFVKLARSGYFSGLEVHRVVPNFVMQDGDPRGDGNGGPGWSIRCEINMLTYDRGAVGMALSGKDTGGSQWFVTHAPQPHLEGGYTVFGRVNETDMKIVDNIVRGDKIISVRIVERSGAPSTRKKGKN